MSFEGRVSRESHEGGLLIKFEGRAPRLGARLCVTGGQTLGKVETVLGSADDPLVHLFPLAQGIEGSKVIGSPVEIAPRHRRDSRKPRQMGEYRGRRDRSKDSRNSTVKSGDWICPKCKITILLIRKSAIVLVVSSQNPEVVVEGEILAVEGEILVDINLANQEILIIQI